MNYLCKKCGHVSSIRKNIKDPLCENCNGKLTKSCEIKTKKSLKDKAWETFSDYIRLSQCIDTTGTTKEGVCYTCGKRLPFNKLQAGHLVSGRTNNVLFDEDNVRIQCYACNVPRHGEQGIFTLNRIQEMVDAGISYEEAIKYIHELFESNEKKEISLEELAEIKRIYEERSKLLRGD